MLLVWGQDVVPHWLPGVPSAGVQGEPKGREFAELLALALVAASESQSGAAPGEEPVVRLDGMWLDALQVCFVAGRLSGPGEESPRQRDALPPSAPGVRSRMEPGDWLASLRTSERSKQGAVPAGGMPVR